MSKDTTMPRDGRQQRKQQPYKLCFSVVTGEEASRASSERRARMTLRASSTVTAFPFQKLQLHAEHQHEVKGLHENNNHEDHLFCGDEELNGPSQQEAAILLARLGLDVEARDDIGTRWSTVWGYTKKTGGKTKEPTERIVLQWCAFLLYKYRITS